MTALISIIGALLLGMVALLAVFVGGMRAKWSPVVDLVRRMNTKLNPNQMQTAGEPGAFAQILRHTGRTTGKTYETPLGIEPTEDGFVIAIVYGDRTQWLRNVLAAGNAEVVRDGATYQVDRPQVVPMADAAGYFRASDRRMAGLLGTDECLRLYTVEPAA